MGVQLNIKDEATVRLARELADRRGKTVTETIRAALEDMSAAQDFDIARRKMHVRDTVAKIQRDMAADVRGLSSKELMDSIYVDGLPE